MWPLSGTELALASKTSLKEALAAMSGMAFAVHLFVRSIVGFDCCEPSVVA